MAGNDSGPPGSGRFSRPEQLITTDYRHRLVLLDARSGNTRRQLEFALEPEHRLARVGLSADGSTAATVTEAGFPRYELQIWDLTSWKVRARRRLPGDLEWTELDPRTGEACD